MCGRLSLLSCDLRFFYSCSVVALIAPLMPAIKLWPSSSICPHCGKTFANRARVASHIAQPSSRCACQAALRKPGPKFRKILQPQPSPLEEPPSISINILAGAARSPSPSGPIPVPTPDFLDPPRHSSTSPSPPHFQPQHSSTALQITYHPTAAATYGQGTTFLGTFNQDTFAQHRTSNIYYPFASKSESELGVFLIRSSMSMGEINRFLKLDMVCLVFISLLCFSESSVLRLHL